MGLMSELLYLQESLHGSLGELKQVPGEEAARNDNDNYHDSEEGCRGREVDGR